MKPYFNNEEKWIQLYNMMVSKRDQPGVWDLFQEYISYCGARGLPVSKSPGKLMKTTILRSLLLRWSWGALRLWGAAPRHAANLGMPWMCLVHPGKNKADEDGGPDGCFMWSLSPSPAPLSQEGTLQEPFHCCLLLTANADHGFQAGSIQGYY